MNKNLTVLIIIIISSTIMYYISGLPQPEIITCTKDVFICRDGSRVRRVEPECKFAACPKPVKEEPTATPSATITTTEAMYQCPENGWVNCMPILTEDAKKACSKEAVQWYRSNCPKFEGLAY